MYSDFILNFIRYIGWPDEVREGDFVIGVLDVGSIASRIEKQSKGKTFGFQDVVVKEYNSVDQISTDCHLRYVSDDVSFSRDADAIFHKVGDKSLIVASSEGAIDYGSMNNIVIRDETLKFEIHKGNATRNGLQINSSLDNMSSAIVL